MNQKLCLWRKKTNIRYAFCLPLGVPHQCAQLCGHQLCPVGRTLSSGGQVFQMAVFLMGAIGSDGPVFKMAVFWISAFGSGDQVFATVYFVFASV